VFIPGRNLAVASTAFLVLFAAQSGCRRAGATDGEAPEAVDVKTETVRLGSLRSVVSGAGIVSPATAADWTIYAPEAGRIAELPKAEGDAVAPGDVLVRFDVASLSSDVTARQADVAAANARVDTAKAQLAKISAMYDQGYVARNALDAAKNAVATAGLDASRAKEQLDTATAAADRAIVRARFPGVVSKRFHGVGDLVSGLATDPVLRVIDPTQVQVSMTVSVQDVSRIQPGLPAAILSPTGTEAATVLSRSEPDDPQATTRQVRLAFIGPSTLPIDSPVGAEIVLAERSGVVTLPSSVILRTSDGVSYVMIAGVDGQAHRRDVHVGLTTRDRVEIIAGVTPGDRVITGQPGDVSEGTLLRLDR
jgi:RND family efflux transporter MFP subunit